VLYGAPSSSNFRDLHSYLLGLANAPEPRVEYIFRHAIPLSRQTKTEPAYLSGYGVSLDLKKMEYSAVDDRRVASGGLYLSRLIHDQPISFDIRSSEPSEERTQGEEVRRDDVDIVTQLINAYPVSETADATGALTEEELHRKYHFLSIYQTNPNNFLKVSVLKQLKSSPMQELLHYRPRVFWLKISQNIQPPLHGV
jgi:UDP-glucose:glycoprotein glucosyltransferase